MKKNRKQENRMYKAGTQAAGSEPAAPRENAFTAAQKRCVLDDFIDESIENEVVVPWGMEDDMPWDPKEPDAYEEVFFEESDAGGEEESQDLFSSVSIEALKSFIIDSYRRGQIYWEILISNGLRDDAWEYYREHINEELPFDPFEMIAALCTSTK